MPTALAISPHLDDAVFSVGGALARLGDAGWDVVVATVFTASVAAPSGFALACQLDKGLPPSADYMAIRRAEDFSACAVLGARAQWLGLREAPHRGYHSAAALFAAPLASDAMQPVADAIAPLLTALRPALLLAPQAIGGHVDHVLTVHAMQHLAPALPVLWWADFPYSIRTDTARRPFDATFGTLAEAALHAASPRKLAACAAYASQVGFQFGGMDGLARALHGSIERLRVQGEAPLALTTRPSPSAC